MKNKYYKTIKPATAKARLTKLIEAEKEAWEKYQEGKALDESLAHLNLGTKATEVRLEVARGLSQALRVMGIVGTECLED